MSSLSVECGLHDLEASGLDPGHTAQNFAVDAPADPAVSGPTTCEPDRGSRIGETDPRSKCDRVSMDSFATAASTLSVCSGDFCKICHCGLKESSAPLIAPCFCSGSLKFVHQECLQKWIKASDIKRCELCKFPFIMHTKVKPLHKWERLSMSSMERRKLLCSLTFHLIAVGCVLWSLYVLIDRTAEEVRSGELQWPFWTKLVVVAIGFSGGIVFMYIQCKVYVHLCRKWRAYNRVIVIQEPPDDIHIHKKSVAIDTTNVDNNNTRRDGTLRTEDLRPNDALSDQHQGDHVGDRSRSGSNVPNVVISVPSISNDESHLSRANAETQTTATLATDSTSNNEFARRRRRSSTVSGPVDLHDLGSRTLVKLLQDIDPSEKNENNPSYPKDEDDQSVKDDSHNQSMKEEHCELVMGDKDCAMGKNSATKDSEDNDPKGDTYEDGSSV